MCGRASCCLSVASIVEATGLPSTTRCRREGCYSPNRKQISPGMAVPVAYIPRKSRQLALRSMTWGLVPSFSKDAAANHFRAFNARSETAQENFIFSRLLPRQTCVVALQGFFEWKEDCDKQKQPFFVHKKDGKPILMAALWDWWRLPISEGMVNVTEEEDEEDDCGRLVFSFTILTCGTHGTALSWLHDRMPLMLPSKDVALSWLEGNVSLSSLPHLDLAELAWHPVTKAMNKVAYDGDDVTWDVSKKIAAAAPRPITNFFSKAEGPLSLKAPRKIVAKNPVAKRPKTIRDHFSPSKQYPGEK